MDPLERFFKKIQEDDNGCWIWTGCKNNTGRGVFGFESKMILAYRFSYTAFVGEIPSGLEICHAPIICNNKSCVNPEHLRADTSKANHADRILDGTVSEGERCGTSKLITEQVLAIRKSDKGPCELARQYGVKHQTIIKIKQRQTWKHI